MGDENESFYDNIILEGIRSDQEIPICRIENTQYSVNWKYPILTINKQCEYI